jgi:uncharacterized NAD(P)/FAD-binding protein YdhS
MTRLYVPATLRQLAVLEGQGTLHLCDDVVVARDDSEDAEYDALMTAAESSAVLAAELDPGERRRVVIVADVGEVGRTIALVDVVAVHADADDFPAHADPADLEDLGWYATQEIADLLG